TSFGKKSAGICHKHFRKGEKSLTLSKLKLRYLLFTYKRILSAVTAAVRMLQIHHETPFFNTSKFNSLVTRIVSPAMIAFI
ncbi:hypothetical protein VOD09_03225, partial [Escherichia coli]|nr:hypothetical protein [Escherichia coli]